MAPATAAVSTSGHGAPAPMLRAPAISNTGHIGKGAPPWLMSTFTNTTRRPYCSIMRAMCRIVAGALRSVLPYYRLCVQPGKFAGQFLDCVTVLARGPERNLSIQHGVHGVPCARDTAFQGGRSAIERRRGVFAGQAANAGKDY